jgi:hypothetical protein
MANAGIKTPIPMAIAAASVFIIIYELRNKFEIDSQGSYKLCE